MSAQMYSVAIQRRLVIVFVCLAVARPVVAQDANAVQAFRDQYNSMMSNFEQVFAARGDIAGQEQARQGREAMQNVPDDQLAKLYKMTGKPDLSAVVVTSHYLASRIESLSPQQQSVPQPNSAGFPGPITLISECTNASVVLDAEGRFALLVVKEVASSILAAATFVCTQDILGENGSAACIPLAIASDIANGFFDTAQFCAGEVTANQVDANFNRLDHIHNDLADGIANIVNTSNTNTNSIITNDNTNTSSIITNDNANTSSIITNDNTNKAMIITNANANKDAIVNELHALGCEIVRLLDTPEGQRASSTLSCQGQPGFPYKWPQK